MHKQNYIVAGRETKKKNIKISFPKKKKKEKEQEPQGESSDEVLGLSSGSSETGCAGGGTVGSSRLVDSYLSCDSYWL